VRVHAGTVVDTTFDEERFAALRGLAGQETAVELTLRLDEDLTRAGQAMQEAATRADQAAFRAQTHILLSIAGTIGATQVFDLAQRLNALAQVPAANGSGSMWADSLAEISVALNHVINRVRITRSDLTRAS
jgi:hypothetical protein